ncbi:MAG: fructose-bisphosphate aldolase, partial [Deltaproteobacteria bacterium]
GRNIFQHKNPQHMTATLSRMVHRRYSVEEALEYLSKE